MIARKLPEDLEFYSTPGVSEDAVKLEAYARRCGGCPKDIFIVPAADVELEWYIGGKKMGWGDDFRKTRFCVLVKKGSLKDDRA